jgi:hypothetical protein
LDFGVLHRKGDRISTIERIKEHETILAIQDTTNIDLTGHPAPRGTGYLDTRHSSGLKVHLTLAVTTQGGPLGLLEQQVWARDAENLGIAKKRRQRQTQAKESQRWLDALSATQQQLLKQIQVVTRGDSEADIIESFEQAARCVRWYTYRWLIERYH